MRSDDIMTMAQVEDEIAHFKKVFQTVRLFRKEDLQSMEKECRENADSNDRLCHTFETGENRCKNCVVLEAYTSQQEQSKLKIAEGKNYQVIARYLEVDGEPCVMEMVRYLASEFSVEAVGKEKLPTLFINYSDKLYKDAVTESYNRRFYEDEIKHKRAEAGVALIDVDDFKLYNDTYGHNAGDMALHTVVDVIRENIRDTDKLIRFGGDEFLLVIPDVDEEAFVKRLQKIRHKIHSANVPGYLNLRVSVSIGGVLSQSSETIEDAVGRADGLMYQAKIKKNMVVTEKNSFLAEQKVDMPKQTILIVDDSELNRAILTEMLQDNFSILEAENGEECMDLLEQYGKGISLVLLDIVMPVMDGFEVLSNMRKARMLEDIPVIMISSEEGATFIRRAFECGASDYISRPFDGKVVYQRVFNTIKLYAKQRRLITMVTEQIQEKEKNNQMMVEVLSQIVEFRNGESGLHVLHINVLTKMILERLVQKTDKYDLSAEQCYMIATASAFHDIGKIGIDEKILNKPGRLTKEEFEIMKKHTVLGAAMLNSLEQYRGEPLIKTAFCICRWHHERYDGKGYPDGLIGEEIPISAQVVSVVDVYDALVSERVYKKAFSHEKAMEMILGGECGAFSPLLLECLEEIQDRIKSEVYC